jgi:hypothetical protein
MGADVTDLIRELIGAGTAVLAKSSSPSQAPSVLYHFTGVGGLLGMAQSGQVWASLATSSNDRSEVAYGITVAEDVIRERLRAGRSAYLETALTLVRDPEAAPEPMRFDSRAFVISLCASPDHSLHWLHYGRSGRGVAVGFRTDRMAVPPFELARVEYRREAQERLVQELLDTCERNDRPDVAGHIAALHLRMAAVLLKDPAFASEQEWRLVTRKLIHRGALVDDEAAPAPAKFRISGGRIVAYQELALPQDAFDSLLIGHSCPIDDGDESLRLLLATLAGQIRVARSRVAVRP